MKEVLKGWAIVNIAHPVTGKGFIFPDSFYRTRREALDSFLEGDDLGWKYWRDKYNFRCVRATMTIETEL